jgi:hypothetical protein
MFQKLLVENGFFSGIKCLRSWNDDFKVVAYNFKSDKEARQ